LKTLDIANGGNDAFQTLQRGCPDLILLDYMMPEMDGPAVLKEIQKLNIDVPVIFLTGKTKPEEIEDIKGLGALGLIKKPFNPKTLHEQILKVWNNL
jgi:two-component system OmpR family response regulator